MQSVASKEMRMVAMATNGHMMKRKAFICWYRSSLLPSVMSHLPLWDSVSVSCPTFSGVHNPWYSPSNPSPAQHLSNSPRPSLCCFLWWHDHTTAYGRIIYLNNLPAFLSSLH